MAVVKEKAPMVLGIGAALAGVFLLFRKKKPPLPEPPETGVVVGLMNPPSEAENWSLTLTDWDITVPIRFIGWNGVERLDITEPAAFEIPSGLTFPLRVVSLQLTKWNEARTALIVLYEVQSYRPYLWDFDIMDWSDEPDPSYKEVFIPNY
ncbi:unnamed protein product, partial [marine sediment metagenome]